MYKVVYWQLLVVIVLALLIFALLSAQKGYSALLGGLAYWVPTWLFIWQVTKHAGAHAVTRFVIAFFTWEAVKLFLSGVFFVLIIKYLNINLFFAVIGLIGAIVAFWMASVFSLFSQEAKA